MPQRVDKYLGQRDPALENTYRYAYMRDAGHLDFLRKAKRCEDFFAGEQWDAADLAKLAMSKRPALTINKLLSTIDRLVGEQLYNRSQIAFRPSKGMSDQRTADILSKLFMQISDNNQLPWVRTDVFADGIVTSRGFYDVRISTDDSLHGEVKICRVPSNEVCLDPDASEYDPKKWWDVIHTKWLESREIKAMFGDKVYKELQGMPDGYSPYDYAGDDFIRGGTFGRNALNNRQTNLNYLYDPYENARYYRVISRQWKELVSVPIFVDLALGDMRPIPETWGEERIAIYLQQNPDVRVITKEMRRVRWTTTTGHIVLQDSWSPYNEFTLVPYFPRLRNGRTIGVVENLIGPQELLNKARSQELHILNTSANSGWKVRQNNLVNMDVYELESKGAETGVVIEVEDMDGLEKIAPNQIPTGLDRVAFKAEEDIKTISNVTDYMLGSAREDVSAKAVQFNQAQGNSAFAPLLDNLNRTDTLLAMRVLDLIQTFYSGPRLIHIAGDHPGATGEDLMLNIPQDDGTILNDLTLGEYKVVVTSEPERDTFEDSQFEQAKSLRTELGIPIPDSFMIEVSRLRDKERLLQEMKGEMTDEEAEFQRQLQARLQIAELEKIEAETARTQADAQLKATNAAKNQVEIQREATGQGDGEDQGLSQKDIAEAKIEMMKEAQASSNRMREADRKFMHDMRLLQKKYELEKALPKPQPKSN